MAYSRLREVSTQGYLPKHRNAEIDELIEIGEIMSFSSCCKDACMLTDHALVIELIDGTRIESTIEENMNSIIIIKDEQAVSWNRVAQMYRMYNEEGRAIIYSSYSKMQLDADNKAQSNWVRVVPGEFTEAFTKLPQPLQTMLTNRNKPRAIKVYVDYNNQPGMRCNLL